MIVNLAIDFTVGRLANAYSLSDCQQSRHQATVKIRLQQMTESYCLCRYAVCCGVFYASRHIGQGQTGATGILKCQHALISALNI